MNTLAKFISLSIIATGIASSADASDAIGPGDSDSRWVLGASAVSYKNIYTNEGVDGYIFPNVIYNGDHFFIKNGALNLSLGQSNQFSGGLILTPDAGYLSDYDNYDDNQALRLIRERDATIEGGFYVNHTSDLGRLNFTVLTDLANEHEGQTASLKYIFDLKMGGWNVNPVVGLEWISDDKVNHYYGVSAAEAGATLAVYQGDSALNAYAGIRGRYEITDHWDVNLQAGVKSLDSSIRDSSIVDEDYTYYSSVAVRYNF